MPHTWRACWRPTRPGWRWWPSWTVRCGPWARPGLGLSERPWNGTGTLPILTRSSAEQPRAGPGLEAWRDLRQVHMRLEVRGAPALLRLEEAPRDRGVADVHLWTQTSSLSRQLVAAMRDQAAQAGFREMMCFVAEAALP